MWGAGGPARRGGAWFWGGGGHNVSGSDGGWELPFLRWERSRPSPKCHLLDSRVPTVVALRDRGDGPRNVALLRCQILPRHEADRKVFVEGFLNLNERSTFTFDY